MMTRSGTKYDAFKIFEHASNFHESDQRLRKSVLQDNQWREIAHPAAVLVVFASELYLKCLLCTERGDFPREHNLEKLFNKLRPGTKELLEAMWDVDIRNPEKAEMLNHI